MHAICVTSWVFQAGEGSAANLEGTVETACHICCGHREWTISRGANSGFTGNHCTLNELITQGLPGLQRKNAADKREFSYFGDSQKTYSHLGQIVTWLEIGHLTTRRGSDTIWHKCTFLLAAAYIPLFGSFQQGLDEQHQKYQRVSWKLLACLSKHTNIHLYRWHTRTHTHARCRKTLPSFFFFFLQELQLSSWIRGPV